MAQHQHCEIYVLDGLNGTVGLIDSYESLIWNMQFFGLSEFEFVVPFTPQNNEVLKNGRLLVRSVDMKNGQFNNVMKILSRKIEWDVEKGWMMTLTGQGLKCILNQRIVWQQCTMEGRVEKIVRLILEDNIINPADPNRRISTMVLDPEAGIMDTYSTDDEAAQLVGNEIGNWLVEFATKYAFGWDVYISGGQYHFKLIKGTNRTFDQNVVVPVVFSPEYDNLVTSIYTEDISGYKNAAVVGGEGEGAGRRVVTIGDKADMDRYEAYIDASSLSSNTIITLPVYMKLITDYGNEQLKITQESQKFEGEVLPNGMYSLDEDYFLGDMVQIENENGIRAKSRITEVIYSEDSNGWSLLPTFSDWAADEQ